MPRQPAVPPRARALLGRWALRAVWLWALSSWPAAAQRSAEPSGGSEETGPYAVVESWPRPMKGHEGWTWGSTPGVCAFSPDRVFVLQRGELPALPRKPIDAVIPPRAAPFSTDGRKEHLLFVVDAAGNVVEAWAQHDALIRGPHAVVCNRYDPAQHVWVVDNGGNQLLEFTNDGKLVRAVGEAGVAGSDATHFAGPSDMAFLPDGSFYVVDGSHMHPTKPRISKFSAEGKFLFAWGRFGRGPGEFKMAHGIAVDPRAGRVYVSDQSDPYYDMSGRIQVFDLSGRFLEQWGGVRAGSQLQVADDGSVWVLDVATTRFLKYDSAGRLLSWWGTHGVFPGGMYGPHAFDVDSEGNLYVAESFGGRVQKFVPRPGAPKAQLIAPSRAPKAKVRPR